MKNLKKALSLILALCMVLTLVPVSSAADEARPGDPELYAEEHIPLPEREVSGLASLIDENRPQVADGSGVTILPAESSGKALTRTPDAAMSTIADVHDPKETVRTIVVFEDETLLDKGFSGKEIAAGGAVVAQAYSGIIKKQDSMLNKITAAVESAMSENGIMTVSADAVKVNYHYSILFNGVSMNVPYGALDAVRDVKGVAAVYAAPKYDLPEEPETGAAQPLTYETSVAGGATAAWEAGYKGEGMKIAIIDTGLDVDHPSFAADGITTDVERMDAGDIEEVLDTLHVHEVDPSLTASDLYLNVKVPYAFCYVDGDTDVSHMDGQGDHGTHVAGIAAANKVEGVDVVGVAPEAQIIVMKVFGDNGGAYMDDIAAALEDAIRLGADAVNMSLGSTAGFSSTEYDFEDAIYSQVLESGMILAVAAGNSGSAALGNGSGTNLNRTEDPDNGTISSPSTYKGATSVASFESGTVMMPVFSVNGEDIVYNDIAAHPFTGLTEGEDSKDFTYVVIPGVGSEEDFAEVTVDLNGKIALIQRGLIDFTAKQQNALAHGAVACIVYDNVEDVLSNMQDAEVIPNVFISKADGEKMVEAAGEDGEGTLTVYANAAKASPNGSAEQVSDFSSLGVTPDLVLMPDVAAYGGHIYSTLDNGNYGDMSGTSMATPQIAGMSALVLQYLHDKHSDLSPSEMHAVAEALLMSTALPVTDPNGVLYSPRAQGAGLANVNSAVESKAYLTVDDGSGELSPKASLGDDDDKNGVYTFTFDINNLSDEAVTYDITGKLLTDQYTEIDDVNYMSETGRPLTGAVTFVADDGSEGKPSDIESYDLNDDDVLNFDDVQILLDDVNNLDTLSAYGKDAADCDYTEDGSTDTADAQWLYEFVVSYNSCTVEVHAGESVSVTATVRLSSSDKSYMDTYYKNGIYVDGFVFCTDKDGNGVELSLPFMGFYGDWSDAKVFDTGWWYEDEDTITYDRYPHVIFTALPNDSNYLLGMNPYVDTPYDEAHNSVSPNGDGSMDGLYDIYVTLMRSAKKLTFTWTDEYGNPMNSTNASATYEHARKACYNSSYGICLPTLFSTLITTGDAQMYDFTDDDGNFLPNGTTVYLNVAAWLDDGDGIADESFKVPVHIDTQFPEVVGAEQSDGTLTLTVKDNLSVAAVVLLTADGNPVSFYAVDSAPGEPASVDIDLTGIESVFQVAVCDYAGNETYKAVALEGSASWDANSWYGYRNISWVDAGSTLMGVADYNGWNSFVDPADMVIRSQDYLMGRTGVNAAEYVDGYVLAIDTDGAIFAIRPGSWTRIPVGDFSETGTAVDMAFDYSTGTLYVLTEAGQLVTMNPTDGSVEASVTVTGPETALVTLAADNDGVLYAVDTDAENATLYTIDPATGEAAAVGETGVATGAMQQDIDYDTYQYVYTLEGYLQSMAVDHESNKLYWANYRQVTDPATYGTTIYSGFYEVDTESGEATLLEIPMYLGEITGLFKPFNDGESVIPTGAAAEDIVISPDAVSMTVGGQTIVEALPQPYYSDLSDLTWETSDDSVVTVENGLITAVGEGTATITVSSGDATAECAVTIVAPKGSLTFYDGLYFKWADMDAANPEDGTYLKTGISPSRAIVAAAYRAGTVYAYDEAGNFYALDPETLDGAKVSGTGSHIVAMAFNYKDGFMYGLEEVTVGDFWMSSSTYYLDRINLGTGETEQLCTFDEYELGGTPYFGMAIDYDGNFYFEFLDMNTYGLKTVKASYSEDEGLTVVAEAPMLYGPGNSGYGSMVYSDANDAILLANDVGQLIWIDKDTLEPIYIGGVMDMESPYSSVANLALFEVPKKEHDVPAVSAESAELPAKINLIAGSSTGAGLDIDPWNANSEVTYSIDDTKVATVNNAGVITAVSAGTATLTVTVEGLDETFTAEIQVRESAGALYGFAIQSTDGQDIASWIKFSDTDPSNYFEVVNTSLQMTEISVYAGAYYDGTIYAYGQMGADYGYENYFMTFDANTFEMKVLEKVSYPVRDMAFDYSTGTLYGVCSGGAQTGALVQFDIDTGKAYLVGDTGHAMAALTCTGAEDEYTLYAIGEDGNLYKLNKTDAHAELVGPTGLTDCTGYQSMHYDLNTGNTYWSYFSLSSYSGGLYLVDLETGSAVGMGDIAIGLMTGAMYTAPKTAPSIPATTDSTGICLDTDRTTTYVGGTVEVEAVVLPVGVSKVNADLTWTSEDEEIATVEDGVITGVAEGTTTVTVTDDAGHEAKLTVTITAEERKFYAYDWTNGAWVSIDEDGKLTTVAEDKEGETPIMAAAYDPDEDVLYAIDENCQFYTVDPDENFARTKVGEAQEFEGYDMFGDGYLVYPTTPFDMSYDASTDTLYLMAAASSYGTEDFDWGYTSMDCRIYKVDTTTGECEQIYSSFYDTVGVDAPMSAANLLVMDNVAYAVDCMEVGMLDVYDIETRTLTKPLMVRSYWSEPTSSRSFFLDTLTGTVYAVRDFAGGGVGGNGETPEPVLYTFDLNDASISEVFEIDGGSVLTGFFLR